MKVFSVGNNSTSTATFSYLVHLVVVVVDVANKKHIKECSCVTKCSVSWRRKWCRCWQRCRCGQWKRCWSVEWSWSGNWNLADDWLVSDDWRVDCVADNWRGDNVVVRNLVSGLNSVALHLCWWRWVDGLDWSWSWYSGNDWQSCVNLMLFQSKIMFSRLCLFVVVHLCVRGAKLRVWVRGKELAGGNSQCSRQICLAQTVATTTITSWCVCV